jgi:hypothetical protein
MDILNISIAEFKMNIPTKENCSHSPALPQEERTANECPKKSLKLSLSDTVFVFSADGIRRVGIGMRTRLYNCVCRRDEIVSAVYTTVYINQSHRETQRRSVLYAFPFSLVFIGYFNDIHLIVFKIKCQK